MRKGIKCKASVTPALCIALVALAVLLLALAEGARYDGLKADAKDHTSLAAESLFAGYQSHLQEHYGMFFLDGGFGSGTWDISAAEDELMAVLCENLMTASDKDGINTYRMDVTAVEVTTYRLATDENGKVFEKQAAERMKELIGERAAKKILDKISAVEEKKENASDPEKCITDADAALKAQKEEQEAAAKAAEEQKPAESAEPAAEEAAQGNTTSTVENPIDTMKALRKQGILALVFPSGKAVSDKKHSLNDCLLKRTKEKGNDKRKVTCGWYERILMQEFLKFYAKNAISPNESGALSYGTEYLICGKGSDQENLTQTVKQLLLFRETLNFLYLQSDTGKSAEALTVATAIAGVSGNPALVSVVKQGILAAWAYVESLCDVKALLAGGKIPIFKDAASFQTTLSGLGEALGKDYKGEAAGLSYENYLDVLLYAKTVKQLAYRGMDLMEWDMRSESKYAHCRMDHMVVGMQFLVEYDADPLFLGMFGETREFGYHFLEKAEYFYEQ